MTVPESVPCAPFAGGEHPAVAALVGFGCDGDSAHAVVSYVDSQSGNHAMQYQAVQGWMHGRMTHEQITDWLRQHA